MLVNTSLASLAQGGFSSLFSGRGNFLLSAAAALGFGQLFMLVGNATLDDDGDGYQQYMTVIGILSAAAFQTVYEITNARSQHGLAHASSGRTFAGLVPSVAPITHGSQVVGATVGFSMVHF